MTTSQVAETIIQAALPIFQASMGLIALLSDDGKTLECERIVGVPLAEAELWHLSPTSSRLPLADAVRERRLVALVSSENHDEVYPSLRELRSRAADGALVAVPLLVGERCVGSLGLDRARLYDAEQRERFLADLAERARSLTDPDEVIADAVRSVGKFLSVSRCVFADIDIAADTCTVPPDYCADASVVSMAGSDLSQRPIPTKLRIRQLY